jgi:predicted Zn-dependent protease
MEEFGGIGLISAMLGKMLITPFNQKNEVASDFYGLDLAVAAGYDACQNISLWKRMQETEGSKSLVDNFISTHPASGSRANCSRNHLDINYSISCPN